MMKMSKKRAISAGLAGIMAFSSLSLLAACGKKEDDGPVYSKRTNVYRGQNVELPEEISYISTMMCGGGKLYLRYNKEVEVRYDGTEGSQGVIDEEFEVAPAVYAAYDYADLAVAETTAVAETEPSEVEEDVTEVVGDEEIIEEVYYDYIPTLYVATLDGTESWECTLETNDNAYVNSMYVDSEGILWIMEQEWWSNEDYTESGNYYRLYSFDTVSGEKGESLDLNAVIEGSGILTDPDEYYYINSFCMDPGGSIHLFLDQGVVSCAKDGSLLGKAELTDGWLSSTMISGEDVYLSVYPNNGDMKLLRYDATNGTLTDYESKVLKNAMDNYWNYDGVHPAGKLYLKNSTGIAEYDFETDTLTEIMNYINCDIDSSTMNRVAYLDDGRILAAYTDWSGEKSVSYCTIYERIPDDEMQEEILINLATTYLDYYLRKVILRFNRQNTGVRISVSDYSDYNNEENEYNGAVTQLNNDMVTGKVPDILVIANSLPVESYFQKNLFVDLNPYIDGENGVDRNDLLDNILRACETKDGKLNSIIPNFYIYTLTAKSKYVGTESGWTLEEMMETIKNLPEDVSPFFEYSRDKIISNLFSYSMDCFIDWETGETFFNTQGFIDLIEFLKTAPEKGYWESYYENMGDNYDYEAEMAMQEEYELRYFKDKALFSIQYMGEFRSFLSAIQAFGTEEITMIGFPSRDEDSNGATIIPQMELAICSASRCKDQAWTFLKYLLTDEEYLNSTYTYTLNKTHLEQMYKQTGEDSEYSYEMTDDDYEWYYENYSDEYVNFLKSNRRKYTEEDGEKVMEILLSANRVSRTDENVLNIITEELSGFFSGSKSAEDAANVINSRVRIYVSENS